eukprot:gene11071-18678_t
MATYHSSFVPHDPAAVQPPQPVRNGPLRLILIVECTAAQQQHWLDFRIAYLEPLFKNLESGAMGQFEVSVVLFHTTDEFSEVKVESTEWMTSMSQVRGLIDTLPLTGGSGSDTCLLEALAEAMYLQTLPSALTLAQQQLEIGEEGSGDSMGGGSSSTYVPFFIPCHCLLFLVSEPHRFSLPLALSDAVQSGASYLDPTSSSSMPGGGAMKEQKFLYTTTELAHLMKDEQRMSFSVVSIKDRSHRLLVELFQQFFTPTSGGDISKLTPEERQGVLQKFNAPMSRSHMALVSPAWPSYLEVLIQQRKLLLPGMGTKTDSSACLHPSDSSIPASTWHSSRQ